MKKLLIPVLAASTVLSMSCSDSNSNVITNPGGTSRLPFTKEVDVHGVLVIATSATPDDKILHAANIMAEYLDSDEDGVVNNQDVVDELVRRNAFIAMASNESELDRADFSTAPDGPGQGLLGSQTHPNGAENEVFDATLEEVLHLITQHGYARVYPNVFGEFPGSKVADAMDNARGGFFRSVPSQYPEGAWFTYDAITCDYGCMITEYTYWALTSILGAQDFDWRLDQIDNEWRSNNAAKVQEQDPDVYTLLTDPEYHLPTVLPDGNYEFLPLTVSER